MVDARGKPVSDQHFMAISEGSRGGCVVRRATGKSIQSRKRVNQSALLKSKPENIRPASGSQNKRHRLNPTSASRIKAPIMVLTRKAQGTSKPTFCPYGGAWMNK